MNVTHAGLNWPLKLMRIEATLKKYPGPEARGSIMWDSETGEISGTLAAEVEDAARQAQRRGWIPCGPQFQNELPVKAVLHTPTEFAAVVCYLGYELPPELVAEFKLPEFPDPLEDMTEEERSRTVF